MATRITITGTKALQAALRKAGPNAINGLKGALMNEAENIMDTSEGRVPFDTGKLRGSAFVDTPRVTRSGVSLEMGYNADYALYVHEARADLHWSRPGSGPKFLERPMLEAARTWAGRRAHDIRAAIMRGFL